VRWRDLADVLRGAFIMQTTSWKSYTKAAVAAGIACAILALAGSFLIPNRYESRAVMRISPQSPPSDSTPGAGDEDLRQRLRQMEMNILGRRALVSLIQEPELDLYREERRRMTIEDVAEKMRTHDIRIRLYGARTGQPGAMAFVISFDYPDRYKARQVVRELVGRFAEMNLVLAQKAGSGGKLQLLESADLPEAPIPPSHIGFMTAGLGAGLLLGLLATLIWRRPKWTRPNSNQAQ